MFGAEITLTPGLSADASVARAESDTLFQVDTGELPDAHAPDPHGTTCSSSPTVRPDTPGSHVP